VQHRTGETAQARGIYHSNCRCRTETRVRHSDRFPVCPTCQKPVTWLFTRSSYPNEDPRPRPVPADVKPHA
jgi:hypothetical protein